MIKLETNCDDCIHNKLCKFKDYAKTDMERLKNMTYGDGPNNDYSWDTMLTSRHVNVKFLCSDFMRYRPLHR